MLILINMTTVFMISAKAKQEMQRTIQEAQGRQDGALMIREIAVLEIQEMATA